MSKNPFESLNKLIFGFKDAFIAQKEFTIKSSIKNMVTKVYCEKTPFSKEMVFLVAPSFFDKSKLEAIVAASLRSLGKTVKVSSSVDEDFAEKLQDFLSSNISVKLSIINDTISVSSKYSTLILINSSSDEPSKHILMRSLCILFACCEKEVSNNMDDIKINEYGKV